MLPVYLTSEFLSSQEIDPDDKICFNNERKGTDMTERAIETGLYKNKYKEKIIFPFLLFFKMGQRPMCLIWGGTMIG